MTTLGINVRADGYHRADWIRMTGATAARVVLKREYDLRRWAADCRERGVSLLWVYARESGDGFDSELEAIQFYARWYAGLMDAVQVGNEPDLESPSSWTLSPAELSDLGWTARYVMPDTPLVCAGLASGQPGWLADVDLRWCNALGIHLYAKDAPNPDDVEDLPDVTATASAYAAYGLPLWMTEWGWWTDDEARGGEETRDMLAWAQTSGLLERYFHFCADDTMVPPFGLYRADGSRKPAGDEFLRAAGASDEPEGYAVGDGLQKELDRRGWMAASNEYTVPIADATTPSGQPRLVVWDDGAATAWRPVS